MNKYVYRHWREINKIYEKNMYIITYLFIYRYITSITATKQKLGRMKCCTCLWTLTQYTYLLPLSYNQAYNPRWVIPSLTKFLHIVRSLAIELGSLSAKVELNVGKPFFTPPYLPSRRSLDVSGFGHPRNVYMFRTKSWGLFRDFLHA